MTWMQKACLKTKNKLNMGLYQYSENVNIIIYIKVWSSTISIVLNVSTDDSGSGKPGTSMNQVIIYWEPRE